MYKLEILTIPAFGRHPNLKKQTEEVCNRMEREGWKVHTFEWAQGDTAYILFHKDN